MAWLSSAALLLLGLLFVVSNAQEPSPVDPSPAPPSRPIILTPVTVPVTWDYESSPSFDVNPKSEYNLKYVSARVPATTTINNTKFNPYQSCPTTSRGACCDGDLACWVSDQAFCTILSSFVTNNVTWRQNVECNVCTEGRGLGGYTENWTLKDICDLQLLYGYGSCNGSVFEFNANSTDAIVALRILNVAFGQTVVVSIPIIADGANVLGTLVSNSNITLSGDATVQGTMTLGGGQFKTIDLTTSNGAAINISTGGSIQSSTFAVSDSKVTVTDGSVVSTSTSISNSVLQISPVSSLNFGDLNIGSGSSLVVSIDQLQAAKISRGENISIDLTATSIFGNFDSISAVYTTPNECYTLKATGTNIRGSQLQVIVFGERISSKPICQSIEPEQIMEDQTVTYIAVGVVAAGVVFAGIAVAVFIVLRRRRLHRESSRLASLSGRGGSASSSSYPETY